MKLVDELYELYKNHLTGDEEDALIIINDILQEFSDEEILKTINSFSNTERFEMFSLYLYEKFRIKVAEQGIGQTKNINDEHTKYFH